MKTSAQATLTTAAIKKMYDYTFDHDRVHICEVAIDSLTVRDTFSVRVLHLL